jgi:ABC-2 type transport system permease protein
MNTYLMLVRRELWEHRSLWIAPAVWVSIILVMFSWAVFFKLGSDVESRQLLSTQEIEQVQALSDKDKADLRTAMSMDDDRAQTPMAFTYLALNALISVFVIIVVFFYLIDCLFTERRDRSILFWKSLPVSDTQVVVSKFVVAMVVVPLGVIVVSAAVQLLMLAIWTLRTHGTVIGELTPDWNMLAWLRAQGLELGMALGGVMWYAPIAAYFMLLSVWARRLVFLWATVPLAALPLLEWFFLGSRHVLEFLGQRFGGYIRLLNLDKTQFEGRHEGMNVPRVQDIYNALDMSGLFTSLEMWIGMGAAAAMLYAAIRIRRFRDDS